MSTNERPSRATKGLDRRQFLRAGSLLGVGSLLIPREVFGAVGALHRLALLRKESAWPEGFKPALRRTPAADRRENYTTVKLQE